MIVFWINEIRSSKHATNTDYGCRFTLSILYLYNHHARASPSVTHWKVNHICALSHLPSSISCIRIIKIVCWSNWFLIHCIFAQHFIFQLPVLVLVMVPRTWPTYLPSESPYCGQGISSWFLLSGNNTEICRPQWETGVESTAVPLVSRFLVWTFDKSWRSEATTINYLLYPTIDSQSKTIATVCLSLPLNCIVFCFLIILGLKLHAWHIFQWTLSINQSTSQSINQ